MMKKHAILFLISGMMAVGTVVSAQDYVPTPVSISKEKVKVDGKLYYSHIVLEKQTLYSICKAYGVTANDVYAANPTLKETGLKKNAIIFIPVVGDAQPAKAAKEENAEKAAPETKKTDDKQYKVHVVKWYETLDDIAEKYGVEAENIARLNKLKTTKLSKRQKLKIPEPGEVFEKVITDHVEPLPAEARQPVAEVSNEDSTVTEVPEFKIKRKVDAILMLPFNAGGMKPSEGNMDYYCGVLMALKDLGNEGNDINLSVYDVADGNLHVTEERLEKSDVVIGPVSTGDLGRLLQVTPEKTAVVSPLDHRTESMTQTYDNLIQAPSSIKAQYKDLIDWISADRGADDPVILINEKGYNVSWYGINPEDILSERGIGHKSFSYSILEGREITDSLKTMMNPETCNRVLIMSDSEAFVNDVVRNLNLMIHEKLNIVLYGTSRIRSFETIEVDNLHNVKLHTSVSYYIDYDSPKVRDFIMQYRALFNTEPTPYAYQGYDTAYFLLKTCSENGSSLAECLEGKTASMLQTDFKFERAAENQGLVNNAVRRVVYGENYSIKLVN